MLSNRANLAEAVEVTPPSYASVPRCQRFNPIAVPANWRKASRSTHDESDDDEFKPGGSIAPIDASRDSRRETVHKQRIESDKSPSSEDAMSSGKVKLVSRKPSLPPTGRQAKFPS